MKLTCALVLLSLTTALSAQRPPRVDSPIIHEDRSVTFNLRAAEAQKVELSGQFQSGNRAMTQGENGIWTITVGPLEPDLYPYNFVVDGVGVPDPANQHLFPNEGFKASLIDIPGDEPSLRQVQDVPHGELTYAFVKSEVMGGITRPLIVYTPPGYRDSERTYPVLYLVSGTTDTEETWFRAGRANFICDNLIAQGRAEPMIIVMPYGNMLNGTPRPDTPEAALMYRYFGDELIGTIMPYVESNYRTDNQRSARAIAGFSRGGGQSLFTGLNNLDKFAAIGSFSAYLTPEVWDTYFSALSDDPAATNAQLDVFWLGVGKSDFLYQPALTFNQLLTDRGIAHEELITEGGHTWMNARHYLAETLQRIFK